MNIDRFNRTERSADQGAEDAFCHELRKFGADWWDALDPWEASTTDPLCPSDLDMRRPALEIHRVICYPPREEGKGEGGGVWVLDTSGGPDQFPDGMAGLRNALTMGERCMVPRRLGAVFCEDAENCSAMEDLGRDPRDLALERRLQEEPVLVCGNPLLEEDDIVY